MQWRRASFLKRVVPGEWDLMIESSSCGVSFVKVLLSKSFVYHPERILIKTNVPGHALWVLHIHVGGQLREMHKELPNLVPAIAVFIDRVWLLMTNGVFCSE